MMNSWLLPDGNRTLREGLAVIVISVIRLGTDRSRRREPQVTGVDFGFLHDPDSYDHVVVKVLIACDKDVTVTVLKAYAQNVVGSGIKTIKVLDSGDDRIGSVVGVD